MKKLRQAVYMFESSKAVRCYFLTIPGHNIIIDTGFPGKAKQLLAELEQLGVKPAAVTDILLTHHDLDHIGNAYLLQQASGAKVWLHKNDLTAGQRPFIKRLLGLFIRATWPNIAGIITDNGEIIAGVKAIETPGHTPGHTIYVWQDVVFAGDAATARKTGRLKLAPGFFNADQAVSADSLQIIRQLPYRLLCPGHGKPYRITS